MKENLKEEGKLLEVLIESVSTLTKQSKETSKGLNDLTLVIAASEERHIKHMEKAERLEKIQIAMGKDLKHYKQNNDDRSMGIEKQILLLDKVSENDESRRENNEKRKTGIIIGLSVIASIAVFKSIMPLL